MFRRAVGSLLARRFSPRTAIPARALHSLASRSPHRDLAQLGDGIRGASGVAAAALAGGGALAYFNKAKKEEDMKARFEDWMKHNKKTYRDEEEKAIRFQVFKDTVQWIESQPPSAQKGLLPDISFFADFTLEERRRMSLGPDAEDSEVFREHIKESRAKLEKGESLTWRPAVKQGDTRATRVSA